jgi:NAD(P)-dependent dehydrogenase (short-subunit alcohol dehydrogenase family)
MDYQENLREAWGTALPALARRNPDLVALEADLGKSTRSILVLEAFPERCFQMETVSQTAGRLDVLVSNAGLNIRELIEGMSEASLDCMLAVNVKGAFLGTKHALALLRHGGGGVILISSSVSGLIGHRANAFVSLASDEAAFITGVPLPVDGGLSAGRGSRVAMSSRGGVE